MSLHVRIVTQDILMLPDGRMNRRDAAAYAGCSEKTLAQKASQGVGPRYIKRGRVWYFKADIDAWLAAGAVTGAEAK